MTTRGSIKRTILTAAMLLALPVGVAAQSAPDLVVPGPNVSKTSVETGETFWFIATVTNDGDAQSQVGGYHGTVPTLDGCDDHGIRQGGRDGRGSSASR